LRVWQRVFEQVFEKRPCLCAITSLFEPFWKKTILTYHVFFKNVLNNNHVSVTDNVVFEKFFLKKRDTCCVYDNIFSFFGKHIHFEMFMHVFHKLFIRLCTTRYDSVLQSTTLYYKVGLCTTKYDSVLQSTTQYYKVRLCSTKYDSVLQSTTLYYKVRLCTTKYDSVLQGTTLYYKVRLCTRSYDSVLQSTTLY